jgi:tetratricopeptide (TPR) repeat protein
MDTRIIKIAIAVAAAAYSVFLFTKGSIGAGIAMILLTAVIVLFVFRSIRLIWAFFQMRKQDFVKSRKWLARINPDKLWKKQQAYYHFLLGGIEMGEGHINPAEKNYKRALSLGLRMNHDKAAAKLSLAMTAMAKQKKREALILIGEAKKLDKKGMMKKDIKQIEQMIKKPQKVIRQRR